MDSWPRWLGVIRLRTTETLEAVAYSLRGACGSARREGSQVQGRKSLSPTVVYGVTVPSVAQSFLRGQLAFMAASGWHVVLGCSPGRGLDIVRSREGIEVVEILTEREIRPLRDLKSLWLWLRLLRRVRPDVINMSTPKVGLIGTLAGWILRVPKRIYVVRGLRYESAQGLRRRILMLAERITIACATDVVAVSNSVREELIATNLLRRKSVVVICHGSSNGVDVPSIQMRVSELDRPSARLGLGLPADPTFVIAFIGRLRRDKGVSELAAAMVMDRLKDAFLLTVGDIEDPDLATELTQLGERWVSVEWLDDVAPALVACDVLCLPTYREGFPNVVLEAAAAERPVVTTDATGARDSVVDGVTGLVVPVGDMTSLADALAGLSGDHALRERFGTAALARVRRDFVPEDIWRGLEAIYRESRNVSTKPASDE